MGWAVGQLVGTRSGLNGYRDRVFKGIIDSVTKGGRASVKFTRPDGGTYFRFYTALGRAYPALRGSSTLKPWTEQDETDFQQLRQEYVERQQQAQTADAEMRRERGLDHNALEYGITLLRDKTEDDAVRLRGLLLKMMQRGSLDQ